MKETSLYLPVAHLLESLGFQVKGEIGEVDIYGLKDQLTIAVELKTQISLKLLYQGVERQKVADIVYIAIPIEAKKSHKDSYHHFIHLLRRLELGLIIVHPSKASIEIEALPFDRVKSISKGKLKKTKHLNEFRQRINDINLGGTSGKKITYYREQTLQIATFLKDNPFSSPKTILTQTKVENTSSILQKNYYGWFSKLQRGMYYLSEKGEKELREYIEKLQK